MVLRGARSPQTQMFRTKAIDRTLEGNINNRFQPSEPVWIRVNALVHRCNPAGPAVRLE